MSKEAAEGQYHYESDYTLGESPLAPIAQRMYKSLSLEEDGWIGDFGGGSGRIPLHAPAPRAAHFLVIDQNRSAIEKCRAAILLDGRMDEAVVGDITDLSSLAGREFRGAISWRVLHSLRPHQQRQALVQIRQVLPVGPLFLAVASDRDWKARELQERDIYVADDLNDCGGIMDLNEPFSAQFFTPDSLTKLLADTGFRVEEITPFQEATGYKHLSPLHPFNDYLYAHAVRI